MLQRTITAVIGILIFIPVCYFSDTWIFPAAAALLCLIGVLEMIKCIREMRHLAITIPMVVMSVFAPVFARYIKNTSTFITLYSCIAFIMLMYILMLTIFGRNKNALEQNAIIYVMCIYIITGFTSLVLIRDLPNVGQFIYVLPIAGPWVSDIFAYLVGRFFGKHKLIPEISPKKTIEGCIGGIVFCALSVMVYGGIVGANFDYLTLAIGGVIISAVSQIGDLIASLVKRKYDIKDYGKIFPGHGGVMDRFDSVIATAPMLLMFCAIPFINALFV